MNYVRQNTSNENIFVSRPTYWGLAYQQQEQSQPKWEKWARFAYERENDLWVTSRSKHSSCRTEPLDNLHSRLTYAAMDWAQMEAYPPTASGQLPSSYFFRPAGCVSVNQGVGNHNPVLSNRRGILCGLPRPTKIQYFTHFSNNNKVKIRYCTSYSLQTK